MNSTEIFPGISIGDIVVSLAYRDGHRDIGDVLEVLPRSTKNSLFYMTRKGRDADVNSSDLESFRKATPEETNWYKSTYKQGIFLNIEDMPKDQVINNYSIY